MIQMKLSNSATVRASRIRLRQWLSERKQSTIFVNQPRRANESPAQLGEISVQCLRFQDSDIAPHHPSALLRLRRAARRMQSLWRLISLRPGKQTAVDFVRRFQRQTFHHQEESGIISGHLDFSCALH